MNPANLKLFTVFLVATMASVVVAQDEQESAEAFRASLAKHVSDRDNGTDPDDDWLEKSVRRAVSIGVDKNGFTILETKPELPKPVIFQKLQRQSRIDRSPIGIWRWEDDDGVASSLTITEVTRPKEQFKHYRAELKNCKRWADGTKSNRAREYMAKLPFEFEAEPPAVRTKPARSARLTKAEPKQIQREIYSFQFRGDSIATVRKEFFDPDGEKEVVTFTARRSFELKDVVGEWRVKTKEFAGTVEDYNVVRRFNWSLVVKEQANKRFSAVLSGEQLSCRVTGMEINDEKLVLHVKGSYDSKDMNSTIVFHPRGDVLFGELQLPYAGDPIEVDARRGGATSTDSPAQRKPNNPRRVRDSRLSKPVKPRHPFKPLR